MSLVEHWNKLSTVDNKERVQLYKQIAKLLSEKSKLKLDGNGVTLDTELVEDDLKNCVVEKRIVILHVLGFLMSKDHENLLTSDQRKRLASSVTSLLESKNGNLSRKVFWCLSQAHSVQFDHKMVSQIVACLDGIFQNSKSVVLCYEALFFLQRLVKEHLSVMEADIETVSKYVFLPLCYPASKIREVANTTFDLFSPSLNKFKSKVSPALLKLCKGSLQKDMLHLFDQKQEKYVLKIWDHIVNLLGENLHAGASVLNALMQVVEKGFKSQSEDVLKATFSSWLTLIKNFSLNIDILSSSKRLQLLLRPLKLNLRKYPGILPDIRDVFWHIVLNLEDKLLSNFEQVCLPLLEFFEPSLKESNETISSNLQMKLVFGLETSCEILLRILEPSKNSGSSPVLSPPKVPPLSIGALHYPIPMTVLTRHFKKLAKVSNVIISAFGNDEKYGSHIDALIGHLFFIVSQVPEDGSRESVDSVTSFLNLLSDVIHKQLCPSKLCFKHLESLSKLPQRMLISHYYHLGNNGVMHDNLSVSLMTLMLNSYILSNYSSDVKFITMFKVLANAGITCTLSPMAYAQTFLRLIEGEDVLNNTDPEIRMNMWIAITQPLLEVVQKTQEVNQGDSLEHDFACMYVVLLYPILHFLPPKVLLIRFKTAQKLWMDLYKIFVRCSSLIPSVEENAVCESFCLELKKKIKKEELQDEQYFESVCQLLQVVIECINFVFSSENGSRKEASFGAGWFLKQKQKPIGNLTSIVDLLEFILHCFHEKCEKESSEHDSKESVKQKSFKFAKLSPSLDLVKNLLCSLTNPNMIPPVMESLANPLSGLFELSSKHRASMQQLCSKLEMLWKSVPAAIQHCYKGPYDNEFLFVLSPVLETTLSHRCRSIQEKSKQFWYATFAQNQSSLKYPNSLKDVLIKSKLLLPTIVTSPVDDTAEAATSGSLSAITPEQEAAKPAFKSAFSCRITPTKVSTKNTVQKTPTRSKKKLNVPDINDIPEEEFVKIAPLFTPTVQRKKSAKKSFLPAMYNELSQNSAIDTSSQTISNSDSGSLVEETCEKKEANVVEPNGLSPRSDKCLSVDCGDDAPTDIDDKQGKDEAVIFICEKKGSLKNEEEINEYSMGYQSGLDDASMPVITTDSNSTDIIPNSQSASCNLSVSNTLLIKSYSDIDSSGIPVVSSEPESTSNTSLGTKSDEDGSKEGISVNEDFSRNQQENESCRIHDESSKSAAVSKTDNSDYDSVNLLAKCNNDSHLIQSSLISAVDPNSEESPKPSNHTSNPEVPEEKEITDHIGEDTKTSLDVDHRVDDINVAEVEKLLSSKSSPTTETSSVEVIDTCVENNPTSSVIEDLKVENSECEPNIAEKDSSQPAPSNELFCSESPSNNNPNSAKNEEIYDCSQEIFSIGTHDCLETDSSVKHVSELKDDDLPASSTRKNSKNRNTAKKEVPKPEKCVLSGTPIPSNMSCRSLRTRTTRRLSEMLMPIKRVNARKSLSAALENQRKTREEVQDMNSSPEVVSSGQRPTGNKLILEENVNVECVTSECVKLGEQHIEATSCLTQVIEMSVELSQGILQRQEEIDKLKVITHGSDVIEDVSNQTNDRILSDVASNSPEGASFESSEVTKEDPVVSKKRQGRLKSKPVKHVPKKKNRKKIRNQKQKAVHSPAVISIMPECPDTVSEKGVPKTNQLGKNDELLSVNKTFVVNPSESQDVKQCADIQNENVVPTECSNEKCETKTHSDLPAENCETDNELKEVAVDNCVDKICAQSIMETEPCCGNICSENQQLSATSPVIDETNENANMEDNTCNNENNSNKVLAGTSKSPEKESEINEGSKEQDQNKNDIVASFPSTASFDTSVSEENVIFPSQPAENVTLTSSSVTNVDNMECVVATSFTPTPEKSSVDCANEGADEQQENISPQSKNPNLPFVRKVQIIPIKSMYASEGSPSNVNVKGSSISPEALRKRFGGKDISFLKVIKIPRSSSPTSSNVIRVQLYSPHSPMVHPIEIRDPENINLSAQPETTISSKKHKSLENASETIASEPTVASATALSRDSSEKDLDKTEAGSNTETSNSAAEARVQPQKKLASVSEITSDCNVNINGVGEDTFSTQSCEVQEQGTNTEITLGEFLTESNSVSYNTIIIGGSSVSSPLPSTTELEETALNQDVEERESVPVGEGKHSTENNPLKKVLSSRIKKKPSGNRSAKRKADRDKFSKQIALLQKESIKNLIMSALNENDKIDSSPTCSEESDGNGDNNVGGDALPQDHADNSSFVNVSVVESMQGAKKRKCITPVRSPIASRLRLRRELLQNQTGKFSKTKVTKKPGKSEQEMLSSVDISVCVISADNSDKPQLPDIPTAANNVDVHNGNILHSNSKENVKLSIETSEKRQSSPLLYAMSLQQSPFSRSQKILQASKRQMMLMADAKCPSPSELLASFSGGKSECLSTPQSSNKTPAIFGSSPRTFTGKRLIYSEVTNSPTNGILKKKYLELLDVETVPAAKKKVRFADPLVQEKIIDSISTTRKRSFPGKGIIKAQRCAVVVVPITPEKSAPVKRSLSKSNLTVCPVLLNCNEPLKDILQYVIPPARLDMLEALFQQFNVKTIGHLCRLSFNELTTLFHDHVDFNTVFELVDYWSLQCQSSVFNRFSFRKWKNVTSGSNIDMICCTSEKCEQCTTLQKDVTCEGKSPDEVIDISTEDIPPVKHSATSDNDGGRGDENTMPSDESKENEMVEKNLPPPKDLIDTLLHMDDDNFLDDIPPLKLIRLQNKIGMALERKERKRISSLALKENSHMSSELI